MSSSLSNRIVGCEFSYQVWAKLESFFASQTTAKIKQLKNQLRSTKKDGPASAYLLEIKKTVDALAAVGSSILNLHMLTQF